MIRMYVASALSVIVGPFRVGGKGDRVAVNSPEGESAEWVS